jgi:hypothetical protein
MKAGKVARPPAPVTGMRGRQISDWEYRQEKINSLHHAIRTACLNARRFLENMNKGRSAP